jgi:AcrR family transcriptional regulator
MARPSSAASPRTPSSSAAPDGGAERPLRARGRATRARLLDAGVVAFSRKGFHATRVDDVVKRARTSHGTFYLYFSSKEELFEQLVADIASELRALADGLPEIRPTAESREALTAWLVEFVEVYGRYGPLIRSWTEADRRDAGDATTGADVLATVADAFAAKVKLRRRKDLDPAIASLALLAMVERVNYFFAAGQLDEDPAGLAATLAVIMMDALFGPGAAT